MAIQYVEDGTFDWTLGQDASRHPDKIRPNQYAAGVNVSVKSGVVTPRPGYHDKELIFDDTIVDGRSVRTIFESGKFQAAFGYVNFPDHYIIVIVSGLVFSISVKSYIVKLLSTTERVSQYVARINWSYAGDKVVIFDYPAYPLILDGVALRRAAPADNEVPVSVLGAYNQNRLFIANYGVEFTAGDAVGNLATPDAPITFNEVLTPSSSFYRQFFALPVEDARYPITAIGFIQQPDTSTGIGQLFVATQKQVYTYLTNQPRLNWGQGQDFGNILLSNAGIAGQRAVVNVNSDLLFLSGEGNVHALSTSRNDVNRWSNVPISREVRNYLKFRDLELASLAVLGYHNNRIFISTNPYRTSALDRVGNPVVDYAFAGMIVLEIDDLASFLSEGTPAWAGLWTGVDPTEFITIDNDLYIFGKSGGGANKLFLFRENDHFDIISRRKRPVRSYVYTRQYSFTGEQTGGEFLQKREASVAFHIQDIAGKFKLNVERKPTHSSNWLEYRSFEHTAPVSTCEMPTDEFLNGFATHQLKQIIFGDPLQEGCSPITNDLYDTFRGIQYRFTLEGDYWVLENFKVKAQIRPFEERQELDMCVPMKDVSIPLNCDPDWTIPEESICLR